MGSLTIKPANQASRGDLAALFGSRGPAHECQCQRYRLAAGEAFGNTPIEERTHRLHEQTACGNAAATTTSGLVGYLDGEPVAWCAVAPRASYAGLVRNANQTAWRGRDEDRSDASVWAITCLFTRVGRRGHDYCCGMVTAAVEFARERGARVLEAYPITERANWGEEHPGGIDVYLDAGFDVVHRPSKRRAVVQVRF
ncbi:MAG: hypothetical protein L0G22_00355 [Propionibacteriaceae bacterium]|nr:hypothetical protein [Propionibacteriaceae bacterium]